MKETQIVITIILIIAQFSVPKKWAFLPLLIAALHTTQAPVFPSFSTARVVIIAGLVRAMAKGDLKWSAQNPIDLLILLWSSAAFFTSLFHEPTVSLNNPTISRIRLVIDVFGTFLYAKSYIKNLEDFRHLCKSAAYVSIPLAIGLLITQLSFYNIYSIIGADPNTLVRNGTIRAVGPFGTPILAGTVGALIFPFFIVIWNDYKLAARSGLASSLAIIYASGSSTPIGALIIGICALSLWKLRLHMKSIMIISTALLIGMAIVKTRPIWYLIAITDFVGGSTGWHRAYLIDMAIKHFDEWWLYGTEYTRHWMPYGLAAIPEHCDLTNYFIHMGVIGGMPAMIILILIFRSSFKSVKTTLHLFRELNKDEEFTIWCIGALLFTHALTCLTISYFDQTYVLFYFLIALISNLGKSTQTP
ncbi:hypothetical protein [Pelagicoccus sp. SDUM812005]|uniref:hypothetical protein n=1 Tax=Pelagicoccus sp. SDUM812005 TaxID=3041257 RepID=UPI00281031AB|nr:hypothetical protein [Pelagicoccus sp. SDUM812005]MDQ8183736.1 hypothetical protein [Pelagicoccus sp. SDUM812005]